MCDSRVFDANLIVCLLFCQQSVCKEMACNVMNTQLTKIKIVAVDVISVMCVLHMHECIVLSRTREAQLINLCMSVCGLVD